MARGLCRAAIFNVADGCYSEHIVLDSILNTSSVNTVTFQSSSGDSSKVVINSIKGSIVDFNSSGNIIFRGMTFNGAKTDATVLNIDGECHDIHFENNRILGKTTPTAKYSLADCRGFFNRIYFRNNVMKHNAIALSAYSSLSSFICGSIWCWTTSLTA